MTVGVPQAPRRAGAAVPGLLQQQVGFVKGVGVGQAAVEASVCLVVWEGGNCVIG